jgi:hypothetical protein
MEIYQGVWESVNDALLGVLTKNGAGLAGRVPSFRSRQIRHDRRSRAAIGIKPIRLQAVPAAFEPRATQIWYETIFQAFSAIRLQFTLTDVKGSAPAPAPAARGYPAAAAAPPGITFDRFVRACVVVKQLTESFSSLDGDRDGWIQLSYEKFMETVLTLP